MDERDKEADLHEKAEGAHRQIAPSAPPIDAAAIVEWRRHGGTGPRSLERASRSSRWLARPRTLGTNVV
jgi:hypothetical protein